MRDGTVLVTGAAGLVGNAVRVMLETQGRAVLAVDHMAATEEGRTLTIADVTDTHRLHALAGTTPLGGIIHCAAYSGPMVARDNPFDIVRVNVLGTANLLELARIHKIPRLVFCSTVSAYGHTGKGPLFEDTLLRPTSVYGGSKAASEHLLNTYAEQHGVDGVALRIGWVYGPRRRTYCALRDMIDDALRGRPTRLPCGRNDHRQYIHVDDAAAALIHALDTPVLPRRSYTVTGGTWLTLGEVAAIVRRVLPAADIEIGAAADPDDDQQGAFDISAAARDLGWRPQVALEDGIRRYAEWLRERLRA